MVVNTTKVCQARLAATSVNLLQTGAGSVMSSHLSSSHWSSCTYFVPASISKNGQRQPTLIGPPVSRLLVISPVESELSVVRLPRLV